MFKKALCTIGECAGLARVWSHMRPERSKPKTHKCTVKRMGGESSDGSPWTSLWMNSQNINKMYVYI